MDSDRDNNWRISSGFGGQGQRMRSPARGQFRGHNYNNSPRYSNYQGGWQQQQRSPYRHHQQSGPFCSTPINQQHHPYRQNRPYFSGGQQARGRFNSPRSFHDNDNQQEGIDAWVSPAMWDDPWKEFTKHKITTCDDEIEELEHDRALSTTQFVNDDLSAMSTSETENVTSSLSTSSILNVSDMIMRSAMESGLEDQEKDAPLPNVSIDITPSSPQKKKKIDNEDGENLSSKTQNAQDLISLITS